jgi:hypothetical protein
LVPWQHVISRANWVNRPPGFKFHLDKWYAFDHNPTGDALAEEGKHDCVPVGKERDDAKTVMLGRSNADVAATNGRFVALATANVAPGRIWAAPGQHC